MPFHALKISLINYRYPLNLHWKINEVPFATRSLLCLMTFKRLINKSDCFRPNRNANTYTVYMYFYIILYSYRFQLSQPVQHLVGKFDVDRLVCLPVGLVKDGPVRHAVEQRPQRRVAAAVVELVEQLHVGNEDRHRLVGLQPYSISFLSFQLVSTFQEIN